MFIFWAVAVVATVAISMRHAAFIMLLVLIVLLFSYYINGIVVYFLCADNPIPIII